MSVVVVYYNLDDLGLSRGIPGAVCRCLRGGARRLVITNLFIYMLCLELGRLATG